MPAGPRAFLFDVLPTVALGDGERLDRLDRAARRIWPRARERGARVYPIGFPLGTDLMTHDAWRRHFGNQWERLAAAKRMHDPDGVLTPSPGIFERDERRRDT
jgi:FAD/FMN-containing dehydrogenase